MNNKSEDKLKKTPLMKTKSTTDENVVFNQVRTDPRFKNLIDKKSLKKENEPQIKDVKDVVLKFRIDESFNSPKFRNTKEPDPAENRSLLGIGFKTPVDTPTMLTPQKHSKFRSNSIYPGSKADPLARLKKTGTQDDNGLVSIQNSKLKIDVEGGNNIDRTEEPPNSNQVNVVIFDILTMPEIRKYIKNPQSIEILEINNIKRSSTYKVPSVKELPPLERRQSQEEGSQMEENEIRRVRRRYSNMGPAQKSLIAKVSQQATILDKIAAKEKEQITKTLGLKQGMSLAIASQSIIQHESKERLNNYVPIALFLAFFNNLPEIGKKLLFYDNRVMSLHRVKEFARLMDSTSFVEYLIDKTIQYEEKEVYEIILNQVVDWKELMSETTIEIHLKDSKTEYLMQFLYAYSRYLNTSKNPVVQSKFKKLMSAHNMVPRGVERMRSFKKGDEENAPHVKIEQDMIVMVIKKYFSKIEDNELILQVLKNLKYSNKELTELLLCTQEEDRVTQLIQEHKHLVKFLEPKKIIEYKLYKVLIVFDKIELIKVFNLPINSTKARSPPVFHELCSNIKSGIKIQSLCFLILNIEQAFWDFDRLWRFYQAIDRVLRSDSSDNWLAHVDNPLLFFARLAHFFQSTDKNLSVGSKEIEQLCGDLVRFCVRYIECSAEETLFLNFFDKDSQGLTFLDYCFLTKRKEIIEIRFVEKVIHNMWDLGRDSKQALGDHFRLNIFKKDTVEYKLKIYRKAYVIPVEETDTFQLEYFQTSRSTYLSVISDIVWTTTIIGVEFTLSMISIQAHLNNPNRVANFSKEWYGYLYGEYRGFMIVHSIIRVSYLLTFILRYLTIGADGKMGGQIKNFYFIIICLNITQFILYVSTLPNESWVVNNLQMLVVITLISYNFYLGLSLNTTGIILRIFARMVTVVIVFGLASLVVMTIIAYPIHTTFINFNQYVEGQTFPQMNVFQSLYGGVLTLFEFVFGAVIFIRPYLEQDIYTYSITIIMVIFSFFGNIMLANMLVAFLANQFNSISENAKYHTLKMQFGLTKILRGGSLDSIYSMPYFLNVFFLPLYLCMIKNSPTREKINRFLRKCIHIVNVFVPWLILYTIYLLLIVCLRYLQGISKICSQIPSSVWNIWYLFVWILVGVPFLVKLCLMDIHLTMQRMLDFRDSTESELYTINLDTEYRKELLVVFQKIFQVANKLFSEKRKSISLKDMLFEVGSAYPKQFSTEDANLNNMTDEDEVKGGTNAIFNKNKYHFERKYNTSNVSVFTTILQKFVSTDEKHGRAGENEFVDIEFLLDKFRPNLKVEKIHMLIGFDKPKLENSRRELAQEEESEMKQDISQLNTKVDNIGKDIQALTKAIARLESKMQKKNQMINSFNY